jgi:hypothetical protein
LHDLHSSSESILFSVVVLPQKHIRITLEISAVVTGFQDVRIHLAGLNTDLPMVQYAIGIVFGIAHMLGSKGFTDDYFQ